jgi:indolepyruvate ferredoxin oxidoreductase alpha subunit
MSQENKELPGTFMLGNESISEGAIAAGVVFATGYPGTPSSEIIDSLAKRATDAGLYVEWSVNEKVAAEGAAAAAFAGLRSIVAMKNAGLSVSLDFFTHLALTGLGKSGGALVLVVCDDPEGHSSGDETDSRWLARFSYTPLLEPTSVQEGYEMAKLAFELSGEFDCCVMLRSYTRLSHASSLVPIKNISHKNEKGAYIDNSQSITPYLAKLKHAEVIGKLDRIKERFEISSFNHYEGPENPKLLIVACGSGYFCSKEAVEMLQCEDAVGIIKLGTLWPFPRKFLESYLQIADDILIIEEVDPFIEIHIKETIVEKKWSDKKVFGKSTKHIPSYGEITPDRTIHALADLLEISYEPVPPAYKEETTKAVESLMVTRGLTWCPGCPHRASFFALERAIKSSKKNVYVTGDIGCYTLDVFPEGKHQMNALHAMGSGTGLASGFGQLKRFGCDQPILSICGDSTFFHASIPALINAIHNQSNIVQIILDNSATAMTGFQPHPGTSFNAVGKPAPDIDIERLCLSLGCTVTVVDPFDIRLASKTIRNLVNKNDGVHVLIFRRDCELLRSKNEKVKPFIMNIKNDLCKNDECGICYNSFRCPALVREPSSGETKILEEICAGCGVCADICPFSAITKLESNNEI